MISEDHILDILKMNSMSVTAARVSIIQFLAGKKQAFISLNDLLKQTPGDINRTTLYRTLLSFCLADMLYKIVDNKNRVFYGMGEKLKLHISIPELTNKHNYHFQCSTCEKIFCIPVKMAAIELPAGFTNTGAHLLLSGICSNCSPQKMKKGPR